MYYHRLLTALIVCNIAFAKPLSKTKIEILSKGQNSMTARFLPVKGVRKYFVSVHIKYLADASADYTVKLRKSDLHSDGYHYIETKDVLKPGKLYEIWLAGGRNYKTVGEADFFTDCDMYSHRCTTGYGQTCLSSDALCDGYIDCANKEDEKKDEYGNCLISLPQRPTPPPPPPPPADAPCILERKAAIAAGRLSYLDCEQDGSYAVMHCLEEDISFNCYCIDKFTGKQLYGQKNYDPFTHWNFYDECNKEREAQGSY